MNENEPLVIIGQGDNARAITPESVERSPKLWPLAVAALAVALPWLAWLNLWHDKHPGR